MCLIYKHQDLSSLPETFTAYKVYLRSGGTLISPHYNAYAHGSFFHPGTFEVKKPQDAEGYRPPRKGSVARPSGAFCGFPIPKAYEGYQFGIAGFHCFTTKEGAEEYRDWMQAYRNNKEASSPANNLAHPANVEFTFVIVPVLINKNDIFATGDTPFPHSSEAKYTRSRDPEDMRMVNAPTYITTKITITDEAFGEATDTVYLDGRFNGFKDGGFSLLEKDFGFDPDTTE